MQIQNFTFGQTVSLRVVDGIAILIFDKQNSRVNLLSAEVLSELAAALDHLEKPGFCRGLVFSSGKENSFIAGADINEIRLAQSQPQDVVYAACDDGKAVFERIAALPYPTVAAMHGRCLGGGTELALVCKIRLMTEAKASLIGLPELALGVIPGWGGCVRLPKLVGFAAASALILSPFKPWSARKAWRKGLVCELVPERRLKARSLELAQGARPRRYRPGNLERCLRAATEDGVAAGFCIRARAFLLSTLMRLKTGIRCPAPAAAAQVISASTRLPEKAAFKFESATFAELSRSKACARLVELFFKAQAAKKEKAAKG
ncbi:MAG: enoyl-CoA hydratase/isomerase family protein [Candidatus Obscuribacterales bacterium]|nr:enoyl-CoA hydratase/isomerase family protein [Candidatus Obscuribacterales bacterium]